MQTAFGDVKRRERERVGGGFGKERRGSEANEVGGGIRECILMVLVLLMGRRSVVESGGFAGSWRGGVNQTDGWTSSGRDVEGGAGCRTGFGIQKHVAPSVNPSPPQKISRRRRKKE